MSESEGISPAKVLYGLAYGGIVACGYLFARVQGTHGGLDLLAWAGGAIFVGHLILFPSVTARGLIRPKLVVRGVLYGLAQVLIFTAQSGGDTSSALVASTSGSIFGMLLGRMFLGERVRGLALAAAVLSVLAVFHQPALVFKSGMGLAGGFVQGIGFVIVRSLMIDRERIRRAIAVEFFWASAVSVAALAILGDAGALVRVAPQAVAAGALLALVIQYAFFHLFRVLDSQRASMLTLSRIPWALALEAVLIGVIPGSGRILAAALVLSASVLLILDSRAAVRGYPLRPREGAG